MTYTVKQLAKIAGVSIRTLHYYDEIGLLRPSFVKENGYRCYEEKERIRLQQILFFKELEFPLADIVRILAAPDFNTVAALQDQKTFLELKKKKIDMLMQTIDETIHTLKGGVNTMKTNNTPATDDQDHIEEYKKEARKRWGHTDAYKQSVERTKHWTREDYAKAARGWKAFNQMLADTMDKGYDSREFQDLIAKQHKSVTTFYDCSIAMFRELGTMYATDPRFRKTYDTFKPGLADCMKKAVHYYCDHHGQK